MPKRRAFITGLLAASLSPNSVWADLGQPAFLSAGKKPNGDFVLCGLRADGSISFERRLPSRGHAAAAHPKTPEAVIFARRPGTYAAVMDCLTGSLKTRLVAPKARHFYGHGTFSRCGNLLFTTENDIQTGRGMIGVWDVRKTYTRLTEFASGGIGPHDIRALNNQGTLVIANGGIETHPDTGRLKLNIPTMQSNLSYLDLEGRLLGQVQLDAAHQRNSIRHLAVSKDDTVAFAMQWQGDHISETSLLGLHQFSSGSLNLLDHAMAGSLAGYLGSVAISKDGQRVAATSPRAGTIVTFQNKVLKTSAQIADVCGIAASERGFVITSGTGLAGPASFPSWMHSIAWDNHLTAL
jgi:hypothetical protein